MIAAVVSLAMAASWASAVPLRIGLTVPAPLTPNPVSRGTVDDEESAAVARLGVGGMRYAGETPFDWPRVQPAEGVWDFEAADAAIRHHDLTALLWAQGYPRRTWVMG